MGTFEVSFTHFEALGYKDWLVKSSSLLGSVDIDGFTEPRKTCCVRFIYSHLFIWIVVVIIFGFWWLELLDCDIIGEIF